MTTYKNLSPSDVKTARSFLSQLIDVIQEDISGSTSRRKYQVFVTGGIGPGITSSLLSSNAKGIAASAPVADDTLTITLPTGYAGLAAPASYVIKLTASLTPAASGNNLFMSSSTGITEIGRAHV